MKIPLSYGTSGLVIDLDDESNITVIEPKFVPGLADPNNAIVDALRHPNNSMPLRALVKPTDRVGVVFSDITRPMPLRLILPSVLGELTHVPSQNITLFNALGTHRHNTSIELRDMLGDEVVENYRIMQNNAFDSSTQVFLGKTSRGHDIWINRELIECDVKVLTGFIEPHFFAGFSGGGKAVMPGMAGLQTVLHNHDARMIAHPKATWGITWGNPIWEEVREVAGKVGTIFLVNVTLNKYKQVTGIFTGNIDDAHQEGCNFVKQTAMIPVDRPYDIVITTNSGYPLDLNLYQSVKGMSAAAQVVRHGGAIIIATECRDGIPDHGLYGQLLCEAIDPLSLLDTIRAPGFLKQDQWQAQIQAQILLKADVYVHSENLTAGQIEKALLRPCANIEETISELIHRFGARARICVLPEGPQTIPYLNSMS